MSDGGWDDAGDADGWNEDGGENAGDWGDAGGADEWGGDANAGWENGQNPEDNAGNEEELPFNVRIENIYYEADDTRLEDPKRALEQFRKVIELGMAHLDDLQDEQLTFVFKSMRNIVALYFAAKDFANLRKAYQEMMSFIPRVTRNEAQDAVNSVLHEISDCPDNAFITEMYKTTADTVKKLPDQERLWFRVNMKYCELCYRRGDMKEAHKQLEQLLQSCRTADGQDDLSKGAELLEIYALDSRMSITAKDTNRLKALYEKTKNLQAAVKDPKSQSVIRECWGQMFGDQGQWSRAYAEFYSAFNSYQEIGDRVKAKQCLKYVVIANMLSGGTSNPFDAREAKAFQMDSDIQAIGHMRTAYEKSDVERFNKALDEILKDSDTFMIKHLDSMIRDFHSRAILQTLKSYRRIRIDFLAETLRIKPRDVEELLIQLILDGQVVGRIDQVRGLVDMTQSVGGGAKYAALDRWAAAVDHLRTNLPAPS